MVSLIAPSSTSLGMNMSSSVVSFFLGRSTVTVLSLPNSFSRMSRSVVLLHSMNTELLARFLSLLTPIFSAFGSTASFMTLFVPWEVVFESVALTIIPTACGWRSLGSAAGWWCLCDFVWGLYISHGTYQCLL
jgi:hypothetical protein